MLILFSPMSRLTTHFSHWYGIDPVPPLPPTNVTTATAAE
jgi:hypothetical protein